MINQIDWNALFEYKDGKLYNRYKRSFNALAGAEAGSHSNHGYLQVYYQGKKYLVHRVVWVMHSEEIPEGMQVDHINGDRLDNRIENLRLVTPAVNQRNKKQQGNNTSGVNGVSWHKHKGKWRAQIWLSGKHKTLGYFANLEEATAARLAAQAGHNFTERHGTL